MKEPSAAPTSERVEDQGGNTHAKGRRPEGLGVSNAANVGKVQVADVQIAGDGRFAEERSAAQNFNLMSGSRKRFGHGQIKGLPAPKQCAEISVNEQNSHGLDPGSSGCWERWADSDVRR